MDNLNNIPTSGNWGDAASKLNDNFNKVKQAVTTVENASQNNKGYFSSLSALNSAFPNPKAGQTAYVYSEASSTKYYIYNAVNGGWVTASVEAPSIGVDISEYTKTGGSTKTTKQIEDDLVQLAGDLSEYAKKDELTDLSSIFASKYVKSHNQYLEFKGFKNTSSPQLSPVLYFAYIASESGTIMGVEAIKGQIIWGDGVSFIVEDVKQSNDFYRELQGSLFNVDGFIRSRDGSIQASESRKSTDYIPINPKDDLIITGYDSAGTDNSAILAYYDKNKEFINYYTSGESSGFRRKITIKSSEIPIDTKYVRVSAMKTQQDAFVNLDMGNLLDEINLQVKKIESKIDEVALTTVPIDAIGGEAITPETNLLASLVDTDIEDSDIWGSGYFRSNGSIGSATTVCYSKDYIRAYKGSYNAYIAITSTYSIVIYDKEKNIIGSVQNDKTPTAYGFSFDLPEGTAYIRISHIKSQSTNNLKLYPVDVVYSFDNSIFELKGDDVIRVGHNFLSELTNSELTDTDIWGSGYLLDSGEIRETGGYHSKKYYKVTEGSYNLRAYIYGSGACLLYDGSFNVISSFKTDVSPFDETIIIPDNAVYIRISHLSEQYNVKNIELTNTIPVVFQDNKILSNISKGSYDYAVNGEAVASHELEMIKRANPPKKMFPIVSFISDDGHIDNINWYVPILEAHDVKSTFVVISGRKGGDYMTNEQIKDLHNKGHEIGGHTKNHLHLADIPIDEAEEEIRHSALDLIDMGIEPYTFVHPFGSRNLDTDRLVREHFKISPIVTIDSTVAEGTCCNTPPIDTYGVKRLSFDSFQTYDSRLQLAKDAVDVAISKNQWLIFTIHPQYPEYNTANPDYLSKRQDVSDLITYIKQEGARILTCKDAMRYYGNSFEVGNKRLDDIYYALGSDGNDEGNFFDRRK